MLKTAIVVAAGLLSIATQPLQAWNRTGHKVIAYIAYTNLSPQARRQVDGLLRKHPDYAKLAEGASRDAVGRARTAFLAASVWPDEIRNDARFYDDNGPATPPIDGFPDMRRHQNWHYIDVPFSTDGTPAPTTTPAPNALTQLILFNKSIGNQAVSDAARAYQLAWLLHITADVHQPLHCVTRFTNKQRDPVSKTFVGDLGGNLVFVTPNGNLHAYWDNLLGGEDNQEAIASFANELMQVIEKQQPIETNEREWIDEGVQIAKEFVYSFGPGGAKENPAHLSRAYKIAATGIAKKRASLAGYRLAAIINSLFSN